MYCLIERERGIKKTRAAQIRMPFTRALKFMLMAFLLSIILIIGSLMSNISNTKGFKFPKKNLRKLPTISNNFRLLRCSLKYFSGSNTIIYWCDDMLIEIQYRRISMIFTSLIEVVVISNCFAVFTSLI